MDTFTLADRAVGHRPRTIRVHVAYYHAARRLGVRGSIFNIDDVAKRDHWTCHVCGQTVRGSWTSADIATVPALTFGVPWADGGRYDRANARLAHYACAAIDDKTLRRTLAVALTTDVATRPRASKVDATCLHGHPLTGDNLLKGSDGRRRCRQCRRDRESGRRTPLTAVSA